MLRLLQIAAAAALLAPGSFASAQCPVNPVDSRPYDPNSNVWKHLPCTATRLGFNVRHEMHAYGPDPLQRMDVFIPEWTADRPHPFPKPVVVWIHGGGFWREHRQGVPSLWPLRAGYIFVSISYRLSDHPNYYLENPDLNPEFPNGPRLVSPAVQWPAHTETALPVSFPNDGDPTTAGTNTKVYLYALDSFTSKEELVGWVTVPVPQEP
jgi:hypothetical protein